MLNFSATPTEVGSRLPPPAAYDATLATALMQINTAALCPPDELRTWACSRCNSSLFPGGSELEVLEAGGRENHTMSLLALVGTCRTLGLTVVAIRGTVDDVVRDWLLDFEAWQTPFEPSAEFAGAKVHSGFDLAWKKLRRGLGDALARAKLREPTWPVAITGHSLGGGIAALAAAELLVGGGAPLLYYTMGEPRVGNPAFSAAHGRAFAAAGGDAAHRIVNRRDIVPHLPPREGLAALSYRHIATEVWLAPNGSTVACDGSGEDPGCSDSVPLWEWSPADHVSYYGLDAGACAATAMRGGPREVERGEWEE